MVQYCFTSTETVRLLRTEKAHDGHLDFHTAPELCIVSRAVCVLIYIYTVLRP